MEISKQDFHGIRNMVEQFQKNKHYELELKYKSINIDKFTKLLTYLKSVDAFTSLDVKESLDIFFQEENRPYRISIAGKNAIQKYCSTNHLEYEDVDEVVSKTIVPGHRSVILDDYTCKFDLRSEEPLVNAMVEEAILLSHGAKKGYRFKKRFSFLTKEKGFQIDCTIIKRSVDVNKSFHAHKTFATSGTLSSKEHFEVEVECKSKRTAVDKLTRMMLSYMGELYVVMNEGAVTLSKSKMEEVLKTYISLWWKKSSGFPENLHYIQSKPRRWFLGPQPVTLEQKHVVVDAVDVSSTILRDYSVTEKADGERYLFYVHSDHKGYFLTSKLDVIATDIEFTNTKSCIIDGEYITQDKEGKPIKLFAAFDMFYDNGVSLMDKDLVERHNHLDAFLKKFSTRLSVSDTQPVTFVKKQFFWTEGEESLHTKNNIFALSKHVLDQNKIGAYPYRIDGLIFTPKSLAIGSQFKEDTIEAMGTWNKLLKWKPPHENTIDFMVKGMTRDATSKEVMTTSHDGQLYHMFQLYVGMRPSQWEPITAEEYLRNGRQKMNAKSADGKYVNKLFTPPDEVDSQVCEFYGRINSADKVVCKNGDIITENSIVEFAYLKEKEDAIDMPYRWVPLRVRKDKVAPNDFGPASSVWRSIHYPVSEQIISGKKKLTKKDVVEGNDVYYRRSIKRDKFASREMMNFHTFWVKNIHMIQKYLQGTTTLLDMACGKGGDIKKWLGAGIKNVIGLDNARDNIENPVDGAYARLMKSDTNDDFKNCVFLTMDVSKTIDANYIETSNDMSAGDREIARALWGLKTAKDMGSPKYWGIAKDGVDAITCMFAIHYFFQSEDILDNFIQNVVSNLKDGGVFMGTCLDGKRVKAALAGLKKGESIQGVNDQGRIMWNIEKRYTANKAVKYGDTVRIYMESIGREIDESLVDMDVLVKKFAEHNIHLVDSGSFEKLYDEEAMAKEGKSAIRLSEEEKRYSFLNSYFVFKAHKKNDVVDAEEAVQVPAKKTTKVSKKKAVVVKK